MNKMELTTPREGEAGPKIHPLKIFNIAKSQSRYIHACAPMVRYSKLAFRQTVHNYGTDICWTPMILAKEFNRNQFARDSDLTMSTTGREIPTIVQFGANSPQEISRASSLVAPFTNGVDLNCGCPQSWACASTLGAALMEQRELVRDMLVTTRQRLRDDGWAVGMESDADHPKGRSVSVKIRIHKDLRKTVDFIQTVLGDEHNRNIDWLTIHPRTRYMASTVPINLEALKLLTDMFGDKLPILVSGDVFTLSTLPYTTHLVNPRPTFTSRDSPRANGTLSDPSTIAIAPSSNVRPHIRKLAGLMSARALLTNPALFAGYETCPWGAVDSFTSHVARAPLPLKLGIHHLTEMCGAGYGPDRRALLSKKERIQLNEFGNWVDVIDYLDDIKKQKGIDCDEHGRRTG